MTEKSKANRLGSSLSAARASAKTDRRVLQATGSSLPVVGERFQCWGMLVLLVQLNYAEVLHVMSLPWKVVFALVPPTEYCGGWLGS